MSPLPEFVAPMLCGAGKPFDSERHLFEVKWDGTRALTLVDHQGDGGVRVHNRRKRAILDTYPELDALARHLPPGCALDGEVVIFESGVPSFRGMLQREQSRTREKALRLAALNPAVFVAFDLLYENFEPILDRPLAERRDRLRALTPDTPRLSFSDGVVGNGISFFEAIRERKLEGMVAKDLQSPYRPGHRGDAWTKIKQAHELLCAVMGWVEDDEGGLRSLILASNEQDGTLCYVGKVGSGWTQSEREELSTMVRDRPSKEPWIPCDQKGHWVEPGLYVRVSYLERSVSGTLRAPVFLERIDEP